MHKSAHTHTHTHAHTAMLHSYLLKALLISEQLDALQQLEVVLLKEAVKGRLHVPQLGQEPAAQHSLRSAVSL